MKIADVVELKSGSPQFRIKESDDPSAATYCFYGQAELEDDLFQRGTSAHCKKYVRTRDAVETLCTGDLLFSLISGKASLVSERHDGYLFTQNFVKLTPLSLVDGRFLIYLLNECGDLRRQLTLGQQGSATLKFTVRQLADLQLPDLPSLERQTIMGLLYFNQRKLTALKYDLAKLEDLAMMEKLKEMCQL